MEIGSIFEVDLKQLFQINNHDLERELFDIPDDWQIDYFNSGRSAIESFFRSYLVDHPNCSVFMPSYICSTVINAAERSRIRIATYPIFCDFSFDASTISKLNIKDGDVLFFLQYFGNSISDEIIDTISNLKARNIVIVEDISLALFAERTNKFWFGDVVIGSLRKWFAIPDGGFIAYRGKKKVFEKQQASNDYSFYYFVAQIMKNEYLKDERLDKQIYLNLSGNGMKALFSDYTIRDMSKVSIRLLETFDYCSIRKRREDNYKYLYSLLKRINDINILVDINSGIIPLGIVISTENRNELINYLIANGIYCNIHWRECDFFKTDTNALWLSNHCITIPCDQRYSFKHMNYIYERIKEFFEENKHV